METREKSFTIRFSLAAKISEALWEDDDFEADDWLTEWEAHIRNRGISSLDEIEIAVERSFVVPPSRQQ